jgi:hypothetical protein
VSRAICCDSTNLCSALTSIISKFAANIQPAAQPTVPVQTAVSVEPPAPGVPIVYPPMGDRYRNAMTIDEFCTEFGLEVTMAAKLITLGFRIGDTVEDILAIGDDEWKGAGVSTLAKRRVIAAVREYWAQKGNK